MVGRRLTLEPEAVCQVGHSRSPLSQPPAEEAQQIQPGVVRVGPAQEGIRPTPPAMQARIHTEQALEALESWECMEQGLVVVMQDSAPPIQGSPVVPDWSFSITHDSFRTLHLGCCFRYQVYL